MVGSARKAFLPIAISLMSVAGAFGRPFAVEDSIAWHHIVSYYPINSRAYYEPNLSEGVGLFSPDHSRFVIHDRHGDLGHDVIVDTLIEYTTASIEKYLREPSDSHAPEGRVLANVNVTSDQGGMRDVRWQDNTHVSFIAAVNNQPSEVFSLDVNSETMKQLTISSEPVVAYSLSGDAILYYAKENVAKGPVFDDVANRTLGQLLFRDEPQEIPTELFFQRIDNRESRHVNLPPASLFPLFLQTWLSPSGRYAIALAPVKEVPSYWAEYELPNYARDAFTKENVEKDTKSTDMAVRVRYVLIDTASNMVKPILDAPLGWQAQNDTPLQVIWSFDETHVLITNTYLPLEGVSSTERARRRAAPGIAEVNIASGHVTRLFSEPVLSAKARLMGLQQQFKVLGVEWDGQQGAVTIVIKEAESGRSKAVVISSGDSTEGGRSLSEPRSLLEAEGVVVKVQQGLNSPAKVYVSHKGIAKELYDPNLHTREFQFGWAEKFTWMDEIDNISWVGGVTYPVGFDASKKYPLIVQTHGFLPDEFLLDGPMGTTTCMAAQAFANAGFVVLQIGNNAAVNTGDIREGALGANGYKSGIAALAARGFIDTSRIGLIAWSRTGLATTRMMERYPSLLKAVSFCDTQQGGYLDAYLLSTNRPGWAANDFLNSSGGPPDFRKMSSWIDANAIYNLTDTKTAVRLEADVGYYSVLGFWELYSILKNATRAVDFVFFTSGSHDQLMPFHRLRSQGETVDWFRFWLEAYEDPSLDKVDKYHRWEGLCDIQSAEMTGEPVSCVHTHQ